MSKLFFLMFPAVAAFALLAPRAAVAGHDNPFYEAAECYREAAIHFEREVDHSRYSERDQRKAADCLEDLTSDLRRAARRPERSHQLLHEWHEIQRQFATVQAIVFRDPGCPLGAEVWPCWQEVVRAHHAFGRLMASLSTCGCGPHGRCDHHAHRPATQNVPTIPAYNRLPAVPAYNSPERFRQYYGQHSNRAGGVLSVPRQRETGALYHYRSRSNQWQQPQQLIPQQTFRPDRQPLYGSPSQRQLESTQLNSQRSNTYRKLNNAATIGALISRLVD